MRELRNLIEREGGALLSQAIATEVARITALEETVDTATTGLVDRVAAVEGVLDTQSALSDSATIALDTVIATDAVVVNGVTLTAVANGATPSAGQFKIGAGATVDEGAATNLAALINSLTATTLPGVHATAALKVVTVTTDPGVMLAVTTDDTTVTVAYTAPAYSLFALIRAAIVAMEE